MVGPAAGKRVGEPVAADKAARVEALAVRAPMAAMMAAVGMVVRRTGSTSRRGVS